MPIVMCFGVMNSNWSTWHLNGFINLAFNNCSSNFMFSEQISYALERYFSNRIWCFVFSNRSPRQYYRLRCNGLAEIYSDAFMVHKETFCCKFIYAQLKNDFDCSIAVILPLSQRETCIHTLPPLGNCSLHSSFGNISIQLSPNTCLFQNEY